jgi:hypothetical protein
MFNDLLEKTAPALRAQLLQLEAERALAVTERVGRVESYMADLEAEIEVTTAMYVGAAVTEIATLRAELSGALQG